jgi:uncharacterized protein
MFLVFQEQTERNIMQYSHQSRFLVLLLSISLLPGCWWSTKQEDKLVFDTIYGSVTVTEPVILEILRCPGFKRLQKVDQFGITSLVANKATPFNRFEHSVGVFALLKSYGAPLNEQVAGLLHDASHTVFSHVGDYVFADFEKQDKELAYQDNVHLEALENLGISRILRKHNISVEDMNLSLNKFPALKCSKPDPSADNIDYVLREGFENGLIGSKEVSFVLKHLKLENSKWFFDDIHAAKILSELSVRFTEKHWGCPFGAMLYSWSAELLRHAANINLITFDEMHYSTDHDVWKKIITSKDKQIKEHLEKILNHSDLCSYGTLEDHHLVVRTKFRGLNPMVKTENGLVRLDKVNPEFAAEYNRVITQCKNGQHIKFKNKKEIEIVSKYMEASANC